MGTGTIQGKSAPWLGAVADRQVTPSLNRGPRFYPFRPRAPQPRPVPSLGLTIGTWPRLQPPPLHGGKEHVSLFSTRRCVGHVFTGWTQLGSTSMSPKSHLLCLAAPSPPGPGHRSPTLGGPSPVGAARTSGGALSSGTRQTGRLTSRDSALCRIPDLYGGHATRPWFFPTDTQAH